MAHTRCKCARFFSVPSGNRSANPSTSGVSVQRFPAFFSVSAWRRCATEILAPSDEGFREVCLVISRWESYSANLAPLVFRGTAISKKFAQCPPVDIVAIKDLLSLRKIVEYVWLIPTGHLLLPKMHQRPVSRNWFP